MASRQHSECGVASVLVLALILALTIVAWGACSIVAMVVAHRIAQNAADLAGLAAAVELERSGDGCHVAEEIASANGARLSSCTVAGRAVTVEVAVTSKVGHGTELRARARGGPVQ